MLFCSAGSNSVRQLIDSRSMHACHGNTAQVCCTSLTMCHSELAAAVCMLLVRKAENHTEVDLTRDLRGRSRPTRSRHSSMTTTSGLMCEIRSLMSSIERLDTCEIPSTYTVACPSGADEFGACSTATWLRRLCGTLMLPVLSPDSCCCLCCGCRVLGSTGASVAVAFALEDGEFAALHAGW